MRSLWGDYPPSDRQLYQLEFSMPEGRERRGHPRARRAARRWRDQQEVAPRVDSGPRHLSGVARRDTLTLIQGHRCYAPQGPEMV